LDAGCGRSSDQNSSKTAPKPLQNISSSPENRQEEFARPKRDQKFITANPEFCTGFLVGIVPLGSAFWRSTLVLGFPELKTRRKPCQSRSKPLQTVQGNARSALRGSNATSGAQKQIQGFVSGFWRGSWFWDHFLGEVVGFGARMHIDRKL
jgi:hypothetical protein